jgi:hypothetical protein
LLLWLTAALVHPAVEVKSILYVNGLHPMASDENNGTADRPLKTIQRAAKLAEANHHQNIGTRIVIYPGIYREAITLDLRGDYMDAPIIFEAKDQGTVILSGADVWTGWEKHDSANIYTHPWQYKWGTSANPWESEHVTLEPIVRRREMVFVDGKLLDQVLSLGALQDGSFYVSEEKGLIYLSSPTNGFVQRGLIEVATRERLLAAHDARNIVVRGLVFQHANSPIQDSAVSFFDSAHITIENCQFIWNNWSGLGFWNTTNIRASGNIANNNGGVGMVAWKGDNLLFEENETSYNNWRGARGGFYGWAVAGLKHLRIHHGLYRRHTAVNNFARGFWLDYDNAHIHIEDTLVCRNLLDGVFIEASQGPVTLKNSTICHNEKGAGVLSTNSRFVTLEGNTIYGNGGSQIKVTGDSERRVPDWQTGEQMVLRAEGWTLRGNTFVGHHPGQFVIETPNWQHFLRSLTGEGNLWYNPDNPRAFKVGSAVFDFSGWQAVTGQDVGSRFADPHSTASQEKIGHCSALSSNTDC